MFHLFDKVYLMYDTNIGLKSGGIIISPNKSIFFDTTVTNSSDYDEQFHYNVSSYDELVGENKEFENDQEFFEYLTSKIQINRSMHKIYCDDENMMIIFIKYMKMLFPKISARSVYKWYSLYFHKIRMHFGYSDSTIPWHKDFWIEKIWFEFQQKEVYDFYEFCKLFAKVKFVGDSKELRKKLVDRLEFSFAIAHYLYSKSIDENYTNETIEAKIKYMYFRTLDDELNKVKNDVFHGVYSLDTLYPKIKCDFSMTPEEIIKQVPELSFVLDEKIGSSFWYWDHYDNYKVKELINSVEHHSSLRRINCDRNSDEWCPNGIFNVLKKENYTALDVLNFLKDNRYFSEIILTRHKSLKFNYYFICYLLEAYSNNELDILKNYDPSSNL